MPESNRVITEDPIEQFVTRLYQVCLNREPDDAGLNDWVNRLSSGQASGVEVSYGFVFSQEFQNYNYCNTDYVKAALSRGSWDVNMTRAVWMTGSADLRQERPGRKYSTDFRRARSLTICVPSTVLRGETVLLFRSMEQFREEHVRSAVRQMGVTAFVTRLYNICLDRNPDTDGLNDWTNGLWDHTKSGGSVAQGFIFSQEFKNKNLNDNDYVEYLYRAFLTGVQMRAARQNW